MSGKIIRFFLTFFIASILFFLLFANRVVRQFYVDVLGNIVRLLLPAGLAHQPLAVQERIFNNVVFAALVLATPKIPVVKRMKFLLIGFIILFVFHIPLAFLGSNLIFPNLSPFFQTVVDVLYMISQTALPFGLWIALTYAYVLKDFRPRKPEVTRHVSAETCPICGKKKKGLKEHIQSVHGQEKGIEKVLKKYSG